MSRHYEAIVIGGGLSGLTCANYLAQAGKRVLMIEQRPKAGGCIAGFRKKGFYFDAGAQSFESVQAVFPILKDLGVYDLHHWEKCEYRMKTPKSDFIISSVDTVPDNLQKDFPDEPGLKPLFAEIKQYHQFFDQFMALNNPEKKPQLKDLIRVLSQMRSAKKWFDPGYKAKILNLIQTPDLRNWFDRTGYDQMPFVLFAGFWQYVVDDYWYPSGGMQGLADTLLKKLKDQGGHVLFKTTVDKILIQDSRPKGVLTANGEVIEAEKIVYSGDYKKLVFDLLGEQSFDPAFADKVRRGRVTESFVSVFLGLDIPPDELQHLMQAHHVVLHCRFDTEVPRPGSDADIHTKNMVELSSPSFGHTDLSPPGKSSLVIQTLSTAAWQNYWQNNTLDGKRTAKYRKLKKQVGMELVKSAEAIIPGLSEKILFMEVATPLTLHRYTWNTDGASAGWSHDQSEGQMVSKFGHIKLRTPIKGLYAAGHYTFWPGGVPSAMSSGKFCADLVLERGFWGNMDKFMTFLGR